MAEYRDADTRRERREIETEVLSETVWRHPPLRSNELVMTKQELEAYADRIISAVENDDEKKVQLERRKPSFWLLERY